MVVDEEVRIKGRCQQRGESQTSELTGLFTPKIDPWNGKRKQEFILDGGCVPVRLLPASRFGTVPGGCTMFDLTKWYAREHVILCLLPFSFGCHSCFHQPGAVIKYFVPTLKSCWYIRWLPSRDDPGGLQLHHPALFSSIHQRGAALARRFLYSFIPAINILAIILIAHRILGLEMGIACTIGAVVFAVVIGLAYVYFHRKEERSGKAQSKLIFPDVQEKRPLWQTAFHFFTLVLILFSPTGANPACITEGYGTGCGLKINKCITGIFAILLVFSLIFILKLKVATRTARLRFNGCLFHLSPL